LSERLESSNVTELVVCGVLTHHSVDATVWHASATGYRVVLPSSCTASFAITLTNGKTVPSDQAQEIFLENLNGEYCEVVRHITL
jgi:nicotinamidase-related amidase